jgi:hypothetical protein
MAMSQKSTCFVILEKQPPELRVGFPDSDSNAVPLSNVRRGDLECQASFTKFVLDLILIRVRGTEGHVNSRPVVQVIAGLYFQFDTCYGLVPGPASLTDDDIAASGSVSMFSMCISGGYRGGGFGLVGHAHFGAGSEAGFLLAPLDVTSPSISWSLLRNTSISKNS